MLHIANRGASITAAAANAIAAGYLSRSRQDYEGNRLAQVRRLLNNRHGGVTGSIGNDRNAMPACC